MTEEKVFKNYPHKHLLGIEGLLPDSINYLINLPSLKVPSITFPIASINLPCP